MTNLPERLEAVFSLNPDATAVEQSGRALKYGQISAFIRKLDGVLVEHGHGADVPVGILLRNRPALLASALAVIWTRRCVVTVNPMLPPEPLRRDLANLHVPVLIAEETDWENPVFTQSAQASGALGLLVRLGEAGCEIEVRLPAHGGGGFREQAPGIAIEMLTSGTTGVPKRVKLELESLSRSLWAGSKYESGGGAVALKGSPALLWMPLVHIGGLWNALYQFYNGRRVTLLEKFDVGVWHDAIVEHGLKFATLPPSALGEVLARNYPREDFASLTAIRCGAAPLDHALAAEFESRYGIPVLEAYGATEFAGGVAGWTIKDHRQFGKSKRKSVGRANPGVELRIVDPQSFEPVGVDVEGLLEVKTKQIGSGLDWIRTTDRARLDEDGFLYILGRADNAINRGGFKIMPDQVEEAIRAHPAVALASVVGIPDDRLGQVPVAAYELAAGATDPDAAEWKLFLSERLKPYEIPVRYRAVAELPRTPSLKVSQVGVRELFLSEEA
jgi:acyl-CoA synthetase (AMP-forming)/AMP-acid ligase II